MLPAHQKVSVFCYKMLNFAPITFHFASIMTSKVCLRLIFTIAFLTLSVSLKVFAADLEARKSTMNTRLTDYVYHAEYASQVTHVQVDASTVTVSGICSGNGELFLADIMPSDDVTETNRFARCLPLNSGEFSVTVDRFVARDGITYDRLLSKWAIVQRGINGDKLCSHARYADEVKALSSPPRLVPANKKGVGAGLGRTYMQDLIDLDAKNITCNWVITSFIAQHPIFDNSIPYTYGGRQYFINGHEIDAWDEMLSFYEQHDIAVSAIILVTRTASDTTMTDVFCHPECDAGHYSMPNMTTPESVNAYVAVLNYLASRYNGSGHGRVNHWIMHNEVDMGTIWTNMGKQPVLVYNDAYIKSMRLCYNIVRQYDQNASILASFTHSWTKEIENGDPGYNSKNMLEQIVRYGEIEGDFLWGVAYHPYPHDITKAAFWIDDVEATYDLNAPFCTFKNLEVVDAWIQLPRNLYRGEVKRDLFLSENGTNTPTYEQHDLDIQAAGACWAWKKTNALNGIDAIMWHNWMDNREEEGLRIGLHYFPDDAMHPGGAKPAWFVWQNAGTANEDAFFEPYKALIGINDWKDIFTPITNGNAVKVE